MAVAFYHDFFVFLKMVLLFVVPQGLKTLTFTNLQLPSNSTNKAPGLL